MRYLSTRGHDERPGFGEVLLRGLAPDGGLYLPEAWPRIPPSRFESYPDLVAAVLAPFVAPDPLEAELPEIAREAYRGFRHPLVAPLTRIDDHRFLLELFWGPTLSFKDYALSLVGALFQSVLERQGRRALVLGATSGDTGSAAIEACRGRSNLDVVILYPRSRVSDVQRRQMTTVTDANVRVVAVEGTFDDCQALVKRAFTDQELQVPLVAVNSINWARVVAQTAYYLWAAARAGHRAVSFAVPTGNFGNAFAGWVARRVGGDIGRLLIANNANHGLSDLIGSGIIEVEAVHTTCAPAMDIQVPSNLERYLYELAGGDHRTVRDWQRRLSDEGRIQLPPAAATRLRQEFAGDWIDDERVVEVMRRVHELHGLVLDPHTAIAWEVGERLAEPGEHLVTIATAHAAKFPEVVHQALGFDPMLPEDLTDLGERPERTLEIPNDYESLLAILRA
ncbi:MAG TPA: threonine synthase [Acidimicrobiia bacterium]|nr:threonine synthase [Acidimicrobiia bacterium]